MIPDLKFIKSTFNNFNSIIFNEILPEPRFRLTKAHTFRGKLVYRVRRKFLKTVNDDFEIRISVNFDLPQAEWEDVVIHEMIHFYISFKGIKDRSSHGPKFRELMHSINKNHGRNITISAKPSKKEIETVNTDTRVKAHFICLARFSDGRLGLAPVAKTRIFSLWDYFKDFPKVISLKWIASTDTWFNTIPHVQKPKLFLFKEEEVLPHLKGARPLERNGAFIKVINRRCTPDELLP